MDVKIDGPSLMSALTNIKKQLPLPTIRVAALFSTFEFKKSTQERHYIFVSFKLQIIIIY